MVRIIFIVFLLQTLLLSKETSIIPKRIGPQFFNEKGYLLLPAPYSIPGIGEGIAYFASFNNYYGNSDLFVSKLEGDVTGYLLGVWDVHLIKNRLLVDLTFHDMDKIGISNYATRGMNNSADTYSILEFDKNLNTTIEATLTFYDRRLEFIALYSQSQSRLSAIYSNNGSLIEAINNQETVHRDNHSFATLIDLTNDRLNPTKGLRTEIKYQQSQPASDFYPDYYTLNYNLTGYVPVGRRSTLALNYFKSDAIVTREGETDKVEIAKRVGSEPSVIDNQYQENRLGHASSLGGVSRLRSYPGDRFIGAHTESVGMELRLNLTAERKPFNLYFMKDIRTGIQFAFFHEIGTAADNRDDLWHETRSSTGLGARFIMGSGVVYRFDFAKGDEGSEMSIIVDYPWEGSFD